MLHEMQLENLILRGDLGARCGLLYARLEKKEYRPETILNMDQAGWPGDWEGRTILALVRLAQTTKKEPAYLHEIVKTVLAGRNAKGYLGNILPDGEVDEQQLSGHSWLLRGLIAYYEYTGDKTVYDAAVTIGKNLFLPAKEAYASYPAAPGSRDLGGEAAGHVAKVVGKWHISTDTGCAYIPLDGVSALYALTKDEELGALLRVMTEGFFALDLKGLHVQTHATLTALRGILRMYGVMQQEEDLCRAENVFCTYLDYGMTASYENYNWFGRPQWTEPCAVIDCFMVASGLYRYTEKPNYLHLMQRMLYNGMGAGQRTNGGFGCNTCTGAADVEGSELIREHCKEAYWCCSMRGGEGLSATAQYAYFTSGSTVTIPYFTDSRVCLSVGDGKLVLTQHTAYPYQGKAEFCVEENTVTGPVTLRCYLPYGASDIAVTGAAFQVQNGEEVSLEITLTGETTAAAVSFTIPVNCEVPVGLCSRGNLWAVFYGNLMLSTEDVEGAAPLKVSEADMNAAVVSENGCVEVNGVCMHPLWDAEEKGLGVRRVLFEGK